MDELRSVDYHGTNAWNQESTIELDRLMRVSSFHTIALHGFTIPILIFHLNQFPM